MSLDPRFVLSGVTNFLVADLADVNRVREQRVSGRFRDHRR
jgi:hypothetical protein